MPFASKLQLQTCFSRNLSILAKGQVPKWDCKKWLDKTKSPDCLPTRSGDVPPKNCKKRKDFTIALESVYGMEIQADNVKICIDNILKLCNNYFKLTKKEREIINNYII